MKRLLLIRLSLSFVSIGSSQKIFEVIETYNNGNIKSIAYHKETRNKIEKVKFVSFYEYGQKRSEENYNDGKIDKLMTTWYESGQKSSEGNYNDGKLDGLMTTWYENGPPI